MAVSMNVDVNRTTKRVILAFTENVQWVELEPSEAVDLAKAIVQMALKLIPDRDHNIIVPVRKN